MNDLVTSDPRWAEVERIVASRAFNRAPRLTAFLTYICQKTIEGRVNEINEQQIGICVFERTPGYNPADDNIVRAAARQLRQKLALYYQTEAPADSLRVEVPKGAYIPVFGEPQSYETPASHESSVLEVTAPAPDRHARNKFAVLITGALLGACLTLTGVRLTQYLIQPSGPVNEFWTSLFARDRNTLIVVGDAGLNLFDNLARRQVPLSEYMPGTYLTAPQAVTPSGYEWAPFARRRYTTLADLRLVDQFHRLPQFVPDRANVRFARDIRMEDLKGNNAILIGSATTNPWSELIAGPLNFTLHYDGTTNTVTVSNRNPLPKEAASYVWSERDPAHHGYSHIALTGNLEGNGHILLIEGTTMGGINAAADFLSDNKRLAAALSRTGIRKRTVEILLEAEMIDGSSSPASQLIAVR